MAAIDDTARRARSPRTIAELLLERAERWPDERRVGALEVDGEERWQSYAELLAAARQVGRALAAQGVQPGHRVGIASWLGGSFPELFLGCQLLGAPSVALPPAGRGEGETFARKLKHIAAGARLVAVVGERQDLDLIPPEAGLRRLELDELRRAEVEATPLPAPASPGSIAFVQYTSGATGAPKGALISHEAVLANVRAICAATGVGPDDTCVSWLPMFHDMGLVGVLLCGLFARARLLLMSPSHFMMSPLEYLRRVSAHRATVLVMPPFGYSLVTRRALARPEPSIDLGHVRLAVLGAEPVTPDLVASIGERWAAVGLDREALTPVYGLAEATLAVTITPVRRGVRTARVSGSALAEFRRAVEARGEGAHEFVSCGEPLEGIELRIRDEAGMICEERFVGEIEVRSPSLLLAYQGETETTRQRLVDGWLRTGDLGFLAEGELHLCGRAKDAVRRAGRTYFPPDIEVAIAGVPGVNPGGLVVFGAPCADGTEGLVAIVETNAAELAERQRLLAAVARSVFTAMGVSLHDVVLVPEKSLPKTTSGKVQRFRCREEYLARLRQAGSAAESVVAHGVVRLLAGLEDEVRWAVRNRVPLGVAVVRIGFPPEQPASAIEATMQATYEALLRAVRAGTTVGRYGPDAVLLILRDTDEKQVGQALTRFEAAIRGEIESALGGSTPVTLRGGGVGQRCEDVRAAGRLFTAALARAGL